MRHSRERKNGLKRSTEPKKAELEPVNLKIDANSFLEEIKKRIGSSDDCIRKSGFEALANYWRYSRANQHCKACHLIETMDYIFISRNEEEMNCAIQAVKCLLASIPETPNITGQLERLLDNQKKYNEYILLEIFISFILYPTEEGLMKTLLDYIITCIETECNEDTIKYLRWIIPYISYESLIKSKNTIELFIKKAIEEEVCIESTSNLIAEVYSVYNEWNCKLAEDFKEHLIESTGEASAHYNLINSLCGDNELMFIPLYTKCKLSHGIKTRSFKEYILVEILKWLKEGLFETKFGFFLYRKRLDMYNELYCPSYLYNGVEKEYYGLSLGEVVKKRDTHKTKRRKEDRKQKELLNE